MPVSTSLHVLQLIAVLPSSTRKHFECVMYLSHAQSWTVTADYMMRHESCRAFGALVLHLDTCHSLYAISLHLSRPLAA
jgi:hypothetical protein